MANTVQIKCISRTERMSPLIPTLGATKALRGNTHVGSYESSPWKMTLNEATGKIESGELTFLFTGGGFSARSRVPSYRF